MIALAMAALVTSATFSDEARIDFPDRGQSYFMVACYSIYTPQTYLGLNCTQTIVQSAITTVPTRHESVVVTAFDTDHTYLVDYPCVLTDVTPQSFGMTYAVTCYDNEVIFANGFQ